MLPSVKKIGKRCICTGLCLYKLTLNEPDRINSISAGYICIQPIRIKTVCKMYNNHYFMLHLQKMRKSIMGYFILKAIPQFVGQFLVSSGLVHLFTDYFKLSKRSLTEVLNELTDNKDLKTVLCYCFGDYGKYFNFFSFFIDNV